MLLLGTVNVLHVLIGGEESLKVGRETVIIETQALQLLKGPLVTIWNGPPLDTRLPLQCSCICRMSQFHQCFHALFSSFPFLSHAFLSFSFHTLFTLPCKFSQELECCILVHFILKMMCPATTVLTTFVTIKSSCTKLT